MNTQKPVVKQQEGQTKNCYCCGKKYVVGQNNYGRYGRGNWRTCSPWCAYYDRMGML